MGMGSRRGDRWRRAVAMDGEATFGRVVVVTALVPAVVGGV